MRKNKQITLIILITIIIILFILAGISISVFGDNLLFGKDKLTKEKQTEAEITEKIDIMVSEYIIEREQEKTLLQFLIEKKNSGEIDDFVDNNDDTFDIIINGYITTINENDLSTTELKIFNDIIVTCSAKKFVENKIQTVITAKSINTGIKQIKLLNNTTLQGNNKKSIAFDHTIEAGKEYEIKVELTNGIMSTKTIKYEDTEAPTATIQITNQIIFKKGKIQANVNIEDNRSGVNIASCKWIAVQNSENLGTDDESLYTGGTFESTEQTISTASITEPGEYYIHLLLKDNIGNTSEVISEKIEIKDGYAISTPEELQAMGTDLAGHYYVVNDIDMSGFEFIPISGTFTGSLDGQGHTISNLTINAQYGENETNKYTGIFKSAKKGAEFTNVLLKNINISSNKGTVGAIVGHTGNQEITITKVGITGNISGTSIVGSFFGHGEGIFENCYARTNLITTSKYDAGGFAGYWQSDIIVTNCYWSGTMTATARVGSFKSNSSNNNQNTTKHSPTLTNCYYNSELFTLSVPAKISGTELITSQFADSSNFIGWDFTNDWYIDAETGYPELKFNSK